DYPFGESLGVTMTRYDSEILLIPQCETVGCLNSIEEIIALEGVDGIFIGPFDLSISMGIPGEFDHPDFIRALGRVRNACRAAGKFTIYFTVHEDKVADGFRSGFDAMTYSMDARVLIQAYRDAVRRIRLNTGQ
ncbi:MAG TPA: aldolase/citrate lyase family protein, partial [Magnetospirillaceae bacterium]|nr:aldolase/citrate lyase family protein [Magnetospirillaceae bacterium]